MFDVRSRVLTYILMRSRMAAFRESQQVYASITQRKEIEEIQVERFNRSWSQALLHVPFYQRWRREHSLPYRIERPSDLLSFPTLTKSEIVDNSDEIFADPRIKGFYTTGGSTGQPTRYPKGNGEQGAHWVNSQVARSWSGIRPFDSCVHIWGHSHLFGSGARGRVLQAARAGKDLTLGLTRLDAYDLSEGALDRNYRALVRADPRVLSGYSSAVVRLCRFIHENGLPLKDQRRLEMAVLCAETVDDSDLELVRELLKVHVVIEYGAAETGVVAMSDRSARDIRLLWRSYILLDAGEGEATITTLGPRVFPLVNYAIGDCVTTADVTDGNVLRVSAITGRRQELVQVLGSSGPIKVSAILPVHILKAFEGVRAVQFHQVDQDRLRIYVEYDGAMDAIDLRTKFLAEFSRDYPQVEPQYVELEIVDRATLTKAGKHALFRQP